MIIHAAVWFGRIASVAPGALIVQSENQAPGGRMGDAEPDETSLAMDRA
jgi:hypothetical protein